MRAYRRASNPPTGNRSTSSPRASGATTSTSTTAYPALEHHARTSIALSTPFRLATLSSSRLWTDSADPYGGGWRTLGNTAGRKNRKKSVPIGYSFLHSAIDDHSRVVYSEILTDEKGATAAAFWERANAYYLAMGITVLRVLSDNGSCYRSGIFNLNPPVGR